MTKRETFAWLKYALVEIVEDLSVISFHSAIKISSEEEPNNLSSNLGKAVCLGGTCSSRGVCVKVNIDMMILYCLGCRLKLGSLLTGMK